jgi:hypothetical protein
MTYSAAMPILYFATFLYLWLNYCIDKYLLFNYYRKPKTFNESLAMSTFSLFKWPILFRCIVSILVFSSRQIFYQNNFSLSDIGLPDDLDDKVKKSINVYTGVYIIEKDQP